MSIKQPEGQGQRTLYFLNASRSIRTAWLLEELHLEYDVVTAERVNNRAPEGLKEKAGTKLGKFPVLRDGGLVLEESGAIAEYLLDTYDKSHTLMSLEPAPREEVRKWIHAAEATFMMHALPILYLRWGASEEMRKNGDLQRMEEVLAAAVRKDLDWLEAVLGNAGGEDGEQSFLVGEKLSAGDIMMGFSIDVIYSRELGTNGGHWPMVEKYLKTLQSQEGYLRAVKKTGHSMECSPKGSST